MVWPFFPIEEEPAGVRSPKHNLLETEEEVEKTVEEALECDYERDCTTLYKAIENAVDQKDFEPIIKFLDTGYWSGSFFKDSVSPADQAKTWVTRFDNEDTNKVKWSQLPLHLAIVCDAPSSIIGRLVKLYPQALRCTDDQHMLPLHLALRHGADDEIIAFLLIRFPDAVNAKGKNGRSAVDCSMRAKDKLRGKILEIFVEKTKSKSHSSLSKENKVLKGAIEKGNVQIDELKLEVDSFRADHDNLKNLKNTVETDLLMKIQELEQAKTEMEAELADKIDKLESAKILHDMDVQKKSEELAKIKMDFEDLEMKAKEEETSLRRELDSVQELVKTSASPQDWNRLKNEVGQLQAYRLQSTKSDVKDKIALLKGDLDHAMQASKKSETRNSELKRNMERELTLLKHTIQKLEKSESTAKTSSELLDLRNEVDQLKKELQDRSEASRTKLDLVVLKKAMEVELRHTEGKTSDQIARLQKVILETNTDKLETKTNTELKAMKAELESLKSEMSTRELHSKATRDVDSLQVALESKLVKADQKSRKELEQMKKTVDSLSNTLKSNHSNDEMIAIKADLEDLKDQLKKKDATSKIVQETQIIKKSLEAELKKSEGKTQAELLKLKTSINDLYFKALENKDVSELAAIKSELVTFKEQLKVVEKASRTQTELDELKKSLAEELKQTNGRTEEELFSMKKAVDEINLEQQASKALKETLEAEIKAVNGKTQLELLEMKRTIDAIDLQQLEVRNKSEWDKMQLEIGQLKDELNSKKNVQVLKTEKEISEIKKVIDELAAKQAQSGENPSHDALESLAALRMEMDEMKADLKNKAIDANNLIQEIELLKQDGQKHKAGLKKFFSKRISSWTHPKLQDMASVDETDERSLYKADSDAIPTFRPPSLTARRYTSMLARASSKDSIVRSASSSSEETQQPKDGEQPLVTIERRGSTSSRMSKKSTTSSNRPPLAPSSKAVAQAPIVETVHSTDASTKDCCSLPPKATSGIDKMSAYRQGVSPEITTKAKEESFPVIEASATEQEVVLDAKSNKKIEDAVAAAKQAETSTIATIAAGSTSPRSKVFDHSDTGSISSAGQYEERDESPPSPSRTASNETNDANAKDDTASVATTTSSKGGMFFKRIRSPPKTSLFRKVKSMVDPSTLSKSEHKSVKNSSEAAAAAALEIPAYPVVRTQSKALISENGDVELETL